MQYETPHRYATPDRKLQNFFKSPRLLFHGGQRPPLPPRLPVNKRNSFTFINDSVTTRALKAYHGFAARPILHVRILVVVAEPALSSPSSHTAICALI